MNGTLDDAALGVRAPGLHDGLRDVATFGPKGVQLQPMLRIGKAASLATHPKGLDYVESWAALGYLAAGLGIGGGELRSVLREIEEIDFTTVVEPRGRPRRLELAIPEVRDGYRDLRGCWRPLPAPDARPRRRASAGRTRRRTPVGAPPMRRSRRRAR
mgnify:CR=1 FL=1